MAKKVQTKYSPEFKISVILDMWENHLTYRETTRKYWKTKSHKEEDLYRKNLKHWERIYLIEGEEVLMKSQSGHHRNKQNTTTPEIQEKDNLIAENNRLKKQLYLAEIELEYLKKLDALIQAEERKNKTKRK